MTPPAEKGKSLLQGGILDFEIVDLLLEGGGPRSVRGVAAADRGRQRFRRADGVELHGGVDFQPPGPGRRGEDE